MKTENEGKPGLSRASAFPLAPLTHLDIVLYSLLILLCAVSFQQKDLLDTCRASLAYLSGHVFDFYDFNASYPPACMYLPSTYVLFALWGIPLKLMGLLPAAPAEVGTFFLWFKLLTTIFVAGSAYLIHRIGRVLGLSPRSAMLMAAFWLASPIMLYSQFMLGQYDVFTTFFMLAGLCFLLEERMELFALSFGAALTFKYFSAFIFLPLLLLKERRPLRLALSMGLFILPLALEILCYRHSPAFRSGVMTSSSLELFNSSTVEFAYAKLPLFLFSWASLCAYCYLREPDGAEDVRAWLLYVPLLASCLFFLFVRWHPQWLLMMTPFLSMAVFLGRKPGEHCLLELMLFYFFIAISTQVWAMNVDQSLLQRGVWRALRPEMFDPGGATLVYRMLPPLQMGFKVAAFSALLAAFMLDLAPFFRKTPLVEHKDFDSYLPFVRLRLWGGVGVFVLPVVISFFSVRGEARPVSLVGVPPQVQAELVLSAGDELVQSFTAGAGDFRRIRLRVARFSPPASAVGGLEVLLKAVPEDKILLRFSVPWGQISAGRDLSAAHPRGLPLQTGKRYRLVLKTAAGSPLELALARDTASGQAVGLELNGRALCSAETACLPVLSVLP
ncbi:MAG: hypothetical protein WC969_05145 [Elusimicrobiota bacterium]|jgi:hypothetical protein